MESGLVMGFLVGIVVSWIFVSWRKSSKKDGKVVDIKGSGGDAPEKPKKPYEK